MLKRSCVMVVEEVGILLSWGGYTAEVRSYISMVIRLTDGCTVTLPILYFSMAISWVGYTPHTRVYLWQHNGKHFPVYGGLKCGGGLSFWVLLETVVHVVAQCNYVPPDHITCVSFQRWLLSLICVNENTTLLHVLHNADSWASFQCSD